MKTITLSANTSWYLYNFRKSTILRFIKDGYRVVCISPNDEYTLDLINLGCEWFDLRMSNKGNNPLKDIRIIFRLIYLYIKIKPKAAFHFTIKNNIYGTWAAYFTKIPAINNISGLGTAFIRKGIISNIVKKLYKLSQPLAQKVYCQNEEDYELLIRNNLVPKEKLYLLPGSGVDINRFTPSLRVKNNDLFRFLFVGRILSDKGIYELIEAFQAINKNKVICNLWICGFTEVDNISAIPLKDIERWKNIQGVKWLQTTNKIEDILKDIDCMVLPSYREGMPRSLLEAGAMGLPSVTTNVAGCRHIIQNKINGLICNPKDSESLRLAMLEMLDMKEIDRNKMSTSSRRIIEEGFNEEFVIDAAVDALNSVSDY